MAPYLPLILCLSLSVHALPRLFEGVDRPGALQIDVGPAAREGFREASGQEPMSPVGVVVEEASSKSRRANSGLSLPKEDILSVDALTLPVVKPPSRRARGSQLDSRQLPIEDAADVGALVTLPVIHSKRSALYSRDLQEINLAKRADVAYYAQMSIGTPPQSVYVQLDTGSFELWVNPDCTAVRPSDTQFCEATGSYVSSDSSTAQDLRRTASLQYGIGSASINYFVDNVSFAGGPTLSGVQFGIATQTTDQFAGIIGLGHGQNYSTSYPNIMDQLVTQGAIRTKAYSLALGSKAEQQGLLVLGGIDTLKYTGALAPIPVIPASQSPDGVARFWVSLQSISFTPPSGRSTPYPDSSMPVFLDSGATLTLLPRALADNIAKSFGSPGADSRDFYPVDCSLVNVPGTIDFAFDGVTIRVPYREMIREIRKMDGTSTCMLGITPSPDFVLLGDTFLRSAYAVFDLEQDVVYMAQYQNCGSRTMELMSTDHIGAIVGLCPRSPSSGPGDQGNTVVAKPPSAIGSGSSAPTSPSSGRSLAAPAGTLCGVASLLMAALLLA